LGPSKTYYEDGTLAQETFFGKYGLEDGAEHSYYRSGKLRSETFYVHGKKDGVEKYFFESGALMCESPYRKGVPEGVAKEYKEDGTLEKETPYENGVKQGFEKAFSANGSFVRSTMYIDGEACGSHITQYYDNGSVCREADMNGFLPDGMEFVYHENGTLQSKARYKNGQIVDGEYEIYDENGLLQETFVCKNGVARFYHENGCLKKQVYVFRTQFNGLCQEFDTEGNEVRSYYCCNGDECESEESFLDSTFEELADSVFFYYDGQRPDLDETSLKTFFREIYEWVMSLPEAQRVYNNYTEILEKSADEEIPLELFVRRLVREFILRLRLPNEPAIETEMIEKVMECLKEEKEDKKNGSI
jgi:antitoxin component YwqK of YwqJK toxin-antitoxin module